MKQWLVWIVFGLLVIVSVGLGKKILAQSTPHSDQECLFVAKQGDINCDGNVDLFDYDIWKTRYLLGGMVAWPSVTPTPTLVPGSCQLNSECPAGERCLAGQCVTIVEPTQIPTQVPTLPVTPCKTIGCVCTNSSGCNSNSCSGGFCTEAQ